MRSHSPWRAAAPLAAALALCTAGPAAAQFGRSVTADTTPPRFLEPPVLIPNANPSTPLAARITLRTDEPAQVVLRFTDPDRSWEVLAQPEYETQHSVPVLGLRTGRPHLVDVTVFDAAGNGHTYAQPLQWTTPTVPSDLFPTITLTARDPLLLERGYTLFNASSGRYDDAYLVIVDDHAEVVWWHRTSRYPGDCQFLSSGTILFVAARYELVELDLFGEVVNSWWAARLNTNVPPGSIPVDAVSFHHDVIELPAREDADFAVMSSELRVYPDYPASETDPNQTNPTANVVGDVIVEFRRDGTIVRELKVLDVLDPYRISYDGLQEFWSPVYGMDDTEDWNHGNAIVFDPLHDAYLYSARHQEAVIRFGRDLSLHWILGPHDGWRAPWNQYLLTPTGRGPFEWQYHQHAPELTSSGTVLMFDNGNGRAVAPDPELPPAQRYSRAVEFRVDDAAMTVEQVWAHGGPGSELFYSPSLCDADELPISHNVLMCDGDRENPTGPGYARIVQLTRTQPAQKALEFLVHDPAATQPRHWSCYRAEHVRSLYEL